MNNWLNLEKSVCAVTGALGGMGTEICREFARNGADVVLLDLDGEKVKAAAAELSEEFGVHAEGYRMNACDEAEVQAAVDAAVADFGRVDVLVNTAGILRFAPMEDLPLSDWNDVINVNLTGYFITSQRFGRQMIKQGGGRLVHISTVASHSPETFSGVYSSTKAGVNMLSKMLAAEWGPYGVRSNCVEPCFVKTPHVRQLLRGPRGREEPQPPHRHAPHRRRRLLQHDGRPHRQARRPSRLRRELPQEQGRRPLDRRGWREDPLRPVGSAAPASGEKRALLA